MIFTRKHFQFNPFHIINFRPDNWVMYHAMEKVPLPNLPQLSMHNGSISNEMPRPITLRPEKKKKT